MGLVVLPTTWIANQLLKAADLNNEFVAIVNQLNGNVDSTNLAANAVTAIKIAAGAVTGTKIAMGSDAQGDILYYNGANYARLGAGTDGQLLRTQGAAANPKWQSAATQAEMEAASSNTTFVSPGRVQNHPGVAKSWVKFNGTGTVAINASYNVTSITDNGTGDWTVNFTTAFSSADYCMVGTAGGSGGPENAHMIIDSATTAPSASVCRIANTNTANSRVDSSIICMAFFGDQ